MTGKRKALGRGLDSMFSMGDFSTDGGSAIKEIEVGVIFPNPEQPRTNFDGEALEELASSIRELGIVQPLSLRKLDDGSYQIIAGERRWRAARIAGLTSVPAYVRTASDSEVTEMALIENIQREDLNAIEVALAFRKLIDTYQLTQERLSERLGKKRATIANHLRLLRLPAEIQLGLRDRKLEMGHARALLAVDDPKVQLRLYARILKDGLSVRRVEELAREAAAAGGETRKPAKEPRQDFRETEARLKALVGSPVKVIRKADGRGELSIRFAGEEEFSRLMATLERLGRQ